VRITPIASDGSFGQTTNSMGNMQGDITDRWYLGRWSLPFLAPPHPSPNPTNASLYAEGLTLVAFTTTGIISPVASGYG